MATPEETTATFGGGSRGLGSSKREQIARQDGIETLEAQEGYRFYAYIPKVGSGISIGAGLDLSQVTSKEEIMSFGVTEEEYNYWNDLGVIGKKYNQLRDPNGDGDYSDSLIELDANNNAIVDITNNSGVLKNKTGAIDFKTTTHTTIRVKTGVNDTGEATYGNMSFLEGEKNWNAKGNQKKKKVLANTFDNKKADLLESNPGYENFSPEMQAMLTGYYIYGGKPTGGDRLNAADGQDRKDSAIANTWATVDNYLEQFTDADGNVNMTNADEAHLNVKMLLVLQADAHSLAEEASPSNSRTNRKLIKKLHDNAMNSDYSDEYQSYLELYGMEVKKLTQQDYEGLLNSEKIKLEDGTLKNWAGNFGDTVGRGGSLSVTHSFGRDVIGANGEILNFDQSELLAAIDGDNMDEDIMNMVLQGDGAQNVKNDILENGKDSDYAFMLTRDDTKDVVTKTDILALEPGARDEYIQMMKEDLLSEGDNSVFASLNDNYDFLTEDDISADIQNNTEASAYWNQREDFLDDTALAQLTTATADDTKSAKEQILEKGEPGLLASREYKEIWANRANYFTEDEIKQELQDNGRRSVFWDDRGDYYSDYDLEHLEVVHNPNLDQYEKIKEQRRLDILEKGQESGLFATRHLYLDRDKDADEIAFYDKQEADYETEKNISTMPPKTTLDIKREEVDDEMMKSYQQFQGKPMPEVDDAEPLTWRQAKRMGASKTTPDGTGWMDLKKAELSQKKADKLQNKLDKQNKRNLNRQDRLALNKARKENNALIKAQNKKLKQQQRDTRKQLILDQQKANDDARNKFLADKNLKKLQRKEDRIQRRDTKRSNRLARQVEREEDKFLRQSQRQARREQNRAERQGNRAERKAKRQDWWDENKGEALGGLAMGAVSLVKAGLGLKSLREAKKDIPVDKIPQLSADWNAHMARMKELSQSGLTAAEKAEAKNDLATGYNLSIKNAMRAAGGSRAAFLANAGVLNANRVEGLLQLSAMDATTQRKNMEMYGNLLTAQEQEKRERGRINAKMSYDERKRKSDLYGTLGATLIGSAIDDVNYYMGKAQNKKLNESHEELLESMAAFKEGQDATNKSVSELRGILDDYQNTDDDTDDEPITNINS